MKYIIRLLVMCAIFFGGLGLYLLVATKPTPEVITATPLANFTVLNSQTTFAPLEPKRLIIPKLHIDATVEDVGLDAQKNMDTPKNFMQVGWYQLGTKPGDQGNAVFAGHLDTKTGAPAVFYNLNKLIKGDEIIIEGENNTQLTFRVTQNRSYPYKNFPLATVFGPAETAKIQLITCEGTYSQAEHSYSNRYVVTAE